jgi:hypothetical protein
MTLKLWCSKCPQPCYIEKKFKTAEEEAELIKNIRCPFGHEENFIIKAI